MRPIFYTVFLATFLLQGATAMAQETDATEESSASDDLSLGESVGPAVGQQYISQEFRSEERRVGKECRSRWSPYH